MELQFYLDVFHIHTRIYFIRKIVIKYALTTIVGHLNQTLIRLRYIFVFYNTTTKNLIR